MSFTRSRRLHELPVLHTEQGGDECLLPGPPEASRVLAVEAGDGSPRARARALRDLLELHGERPGELILSLGEESYEQRLLQLPRLKGAELAGVLLRKAAHLIGSDERSTCFHALPAELPYEEVEGTTRYLLHALSRPRLAGLMSAFQEEGFRIVRVVLRRMAALQAASSAQRMLQGVRLIVGAEGRSVAFSLVEEARLLHQAVVPGAFQESGLAASFLLQELRNLIAYWRRVSRGGDIAEVDLIGFEASVSENLLPAIHSAVPAAAVQRLPAEEDPRAEGPRRVLLEACRLAGPFQIDLALPLPPKRRNLLALSTVVCALVGLGSMMAVTVLQQDRARLASQVRGLLREAGDVEGVEERLQDLQALQAELRDERGRLHAAGSAGLDVALLLEELRASFGTRAGLASIHVDGEARPAWVRIGGWTVSDPLESLLALRTIEERLARSVSLKSAQCRPPSATPRRTGGAAELEFDVLAELRQRP